VRQESHLRPSSSRDAALLLSYTRIVRARGLEPLLIGWKPIVRPLHQASRKFMVHGCGACAELGELVANRLGGAAQGPYAPRAGIEPAMCFHARLTAACHTTWRPRNRRRPGRRKRLHSPDFRLSRPSLEPAARIERATSRLQNERSAA
jgi:hypothetical protein